jgi:hypothetical protein
MHHSQEARKDKKNQEKEEYFTFIIISSWQIPNL